jgi:hypothetical protein|tara:strand:- start:394 stop:804 length:411 start_codon:yes stop_codon:yes gene_type:complete
MKKLFSKLFGGAGLDIADKIGGLVDKFVRTKDEKAEFEKQMTQVFMQHELDLEKEISARHKADMSSDSWLSKNIRPMITLFSLAIYTIFALLDGNVGSFNLQNQYVDLMGQILSYALGFYFTSRGLEKISTIVKKN